MLVQGCAFTGTDVLYLVIFPLRCVHGVRFHSPTAITQHDIGHCPAAAEPCGSDSQQQQRQHHGGRRKRTEGELKVGYSNLGPCTGAPW